MEEAEKQASREWDSLKGLKCKDLLFKVHRQELGEFVAVRCPNCRRLIGQHVACCALQCECGAWLCALCIKSGEGWDTAAAHEHVRRCKERPPEMTDALFLSAEHWYKHIARKQHKGTLQYLSRHSDLPKAVKLELKQAFPWPHE